ncbi:MAG: CoB--CoM heterodisulfide reductase subunit C [Euryarchaeota archaeon]|jgi:heterodisulfide reductase subunit C|nr:CoB--CoM heterodisulfide reductase subunit C [Euryarchaeota archaeon]
MSFLNRLKRALTGEGEPGEKKPKETAKTEEPQVKTEPEKPPVEEKEPETSAEEQVTVEVETIPEEEIPEEKEESTEEKTPATDEPLAPVTSESETTEETEPESPEEKPEKSSEEELSEEIDEPAEEPEEAVEEPKKERSESMTLLNADENKITRADIDPRFKEEVMEAGAESVAICFQCGTCTGACPSGRRTPYRIRQLVRRAVMGLKNDVISDDSIWMCTTCYECQERCPRGIKIVDVVKIVRNYAAQAGYMAPAHKAVGSFVLKTGHGVPINDVTMELRKRVGLDELPPTTHTFPEALEEVQTIIKASGFDKLIGYNWEKGELE